MTVSPLRHGDTIARWEALGTSIVLVLAQASGDLLARARAAVEAQLEEVDLACSRFRDDSELSRINRAGGCATHISPMLAEAVDVALRAAELTHGAVDPTIGNALVLAGYDRDWHELEQLSPAPAARIADARSAPPSFRPAFITATVGWRTVELDVARASIRLPAGVSLDLGATAKAWAADRACLAAHHATGTGALLAIGGDIATSGPSPAGGWRVRVTDDHRSPLQAPGQSVTISGGGLATSSITARRWAHRGRAMHHIIDPVTQEPIGGRWRTVSVAAGDCLDANIASTAALVLADGAVPWLNERGLPARLVDGSGAVLTLGGWPPDPQAPAVAKEQEIAAW